MFEKKKRRRKIIWFNPPYSRTVKTKIAHNFLKLIDKHFPRNSKFYKIFNRNTIKVSYSCMNNMSQIIKLHNTKVTEETVEPVKPCNCQKKEVRLLEGKYQTPNIV